MASRAEAGATRASAAANEANLLLTLGAFDVAEEKLELALRLARELGHQNLEGQVLIYRAELLRWRTDRRAARSCLATARKVLDPAAQAEREELCLLEAALAFDEGDAQQAAALIAPLRDKESAPAALGLFAARLLLAQQDVEAAARLVRGCLDGGLALERGYEAWVLLYRCQVTLGDPAAGETAKRAESELLRLRRQIPPQLRQGFDVHPAVLSARAGLAAQGPAPLAVGAIERLLEINRELYERLPLPQLLDRVLEGAIELTGAERGFVLLQQNQRLKLAASRTLDGEVVRRAGAKFSISIAERALAEQRTIVVAEQRTISAFSSSSASAVCGCAACCVCPSVQAIGCEERFTSTIAFGRTSLARAPCGSAKPLPSKPVLRSRTRGC